MTYKSYLGRALEKTVTNKKYIHEQIKSGLNFRIFCYYSVQDIELYYLLSKLMNNKIYKPVERRLVLKFNLRKSGMRLCIFD